jgi:hypothetical protein
MSDGKYEPISNPESLLNRSRAEDTRIDGDSYPAITVTLENIDTAIMNHLKETINPQVKFDDRSINVPVIYASPERWKTIQKDGFFRDPKQDKLQVPLISIRRVNISRDNMTNPSNKYIYQTYTNEWNSRNVYDRFAVQNNVRPSARIRNIIIPDYINIMYEIIIWTDLEAQMNEIIEQINVENEEWWGPRNNFKFRTKIEEYTSENDLPPTADRTVRSVFNMKVSAYLLPSMHVKNYEKMATNTERYSKKKVIIQEEVEER